MYTSRFVVVALHKSLFSFPLGSFLHLYVRFRTIPSTTQICHLQNASSFLEVSANHQQSSLTTSIKRWHKPGSSPQDFEFCKGFNKYVSQAMSVLFQSKLLSFIEIHTRRFASESSKVLGEKERCCCRAVILLCYTNHFGSKN